MAQATTTATLFLGLKLTEGTELYYNPEFSQGFGVDLCRFSQASNNTSAELTRGLEQIQQVGHAIHEAFGGFNTQLFQAGDGVAIGRLGGVTQHLHDATLHLVTHHVFPAAGFVVDELPLQANDVAEQTLGEAVLAHDVHSLRAAILGEL